MRELLTGYGPVGIMWFDGGGSFRGADYGTPEQKIPGKKQETAFEVCMTLNRHWGYNKHVEDQHDLADPGNEYVITNNKTANSNLRTQFLRLLKRAMGEAMAPVVS